MDFTQPIEISTHNYWVGMYLENDPFQCHPYFIENGDESVLIDPGSMLEFEAVVRNVKSISALSKIKYIILHHQDPDLAAAVPEIEKLINRDDLLIITHSRMVPLVKHYLITSDYYEIDKHEHKLDAGALHLDFLTTPYCHSPGAFVTYEPSTKTLFSGDIFGGIEDSWEFYAGADYFEKAKQFHAEYMPSKDIFNYALSKIEKLDINLIAPQHGSIIERKYIPELIKDMKNLECGLYIEEGYQEELIDTIDDLKKKDMALLESLSHFQILMDTMHEAVIVSNEERLIIDINEATHHIFHYDKDEFLKMKLEDIVSMNSLESFNSALQENYVEPFEVSLVREDGKSIPALVGGRNSTREGQAVRITTVIDLSELKEKEELLFQKAKMAEMGEMIANIAHQWRQPLAIINTIISIIKEKNERAQLEHDDVQSKLHEVGTNIQYMSNTINDFMSFYRPNKDKENFSLHSVVEQALEILRPALSALNIKVVFKQTQVVNVHGYINEYTQVLLALINNAKDVLRHKQSENATIILEIYAKNSEGILEISDNGGGIKEENLKRIFEPYFTTKHKSRGTGLGLYIAKMIIENSMDGELSVSNTEEGAKFCILMKEI